VQFSAARYARLVCWLVVLAGATLGAFYAGYRIGHFDGYTQFEAYYDGMFERMAPVGKGSAEVPR
jgi:hypothetical protein